MIAKYATRLITNHVFCNEWRYWYHMECLGLSEKEIEGINEATDKDKWSYSICFEVSKQRQGLTDSSNIANSQEGDGITTHYPITTENSQANSDDGNTQPIPLSSRSNRLSCLTESQTSLFADRTAALRVAQ